MQRSATVSDLASTKEFWLLIAILALLSLSSCGEFPDTRPISQAEFAVSAMKRIAPDRSDAYSPNDWAQADYVVTASSRILIRDAQLSRHEEDFVVGSQHPAYLALHILEGARDRAVGQLLLCPLLRNWMLLATWSAAHPYGTEGRWAQPGGDFREEDCLIGEAFPDTLNDLRFNVTTWVRDELIAERRNYGFVLISRGARLRVSGEESPHSPYFLIDTR